MEKKLLKTSDKNYLIGENGVVFDEDGKETSDLVERDNHYYLKGIAVHRIVYQLFKGDIPLGYCCHHINTCPQDNRASNLILISNGDHSKLHGDIIQHPQFKEYLINNSQPHYYENIHLPTKRVPKEFQRCNDLRYGSSNSSFSIAKFEKKWPERKKELRIDELSDSQLKRLLKKKRF